MNRIVAVLLLLGGCWPLRAESIVPNKLDPALSDTREAAFIPWSTQEEADAAWKSLSPTNIPVFWEKRDDGDQRSIYIPSEGAAYWLWMGMTKAAFLSLNREKEASGLELISIIPSKDEQGNDLYGGLWVGRSKVAYVKDKMRSLGIAPASIDYSLWDRTISLSKALDPFAGAFALLALGIGLLNFALVAFRNRSVLKPVIEEQPSHSR